MCVSYSNFIAIINTATFLSVPKDTSALFDFKLA